MMKSFVLLAFILASLISSGQALKCYVCEEESCKNETTCDSSKVVPKGQKGQPPYERCLVRRERTKDGTKTRKLCAFAFQCHVEWQCSNAPKNSICEIGCCDGDLCNGDSLVTSSEPSKTFKPSGADLSCFSCSDLPVKNDSIVFAPNSCSRPLYIRKCSPQVTHYVKTIKQDRCLTLKVQVKEETGEIKEMFYRNCSDTVLCDYSNALWVHGLNQSMGTVVSAQASCCSGNLCEPGKSNASLWKPCLFYLFVVVITTRLNWNHL